MIITVRVRNFSLTYNTQGTGTWDGKITNYPNTQRRDVQIVQPQGYLVVQYDTDNPGVWPFHCHIAWHVSGGLYVNLMEQTDKIKQRTVPQVSFFPAGFFFDVCYFRVGGEN